MQAGTGTSVGLLGVVVKEVGGLERRLVNRSGDSMRPATNNTRARLTGQ